MDTQECNFLDFSFIFKCSSQKRGNLWSYCPTVCADKSTAPRTLFIVLWSNWSFQFLLQWKWRTDLQINCLILNSKVIWGTATEKYTRAHSRQRNDYSSKNSTITTHTQTEVKYIYAHAHKHTEICTPRDGETHMHERCPSITHALPAVR